MLGTPDASVPFSGLSSGTLASGVPFSCIRHPQRLKGASGIPLDRGRCPYGRGGLGMTEIMQNG